MEAQLAELQAARPKTAAAPKAPRRRPCRQALPEHLRRVETHHEPRENRLRDTPDCGQPVTCVGEDVSERLDIVPAESIFLNTGASRFKWWPTSANHPVATPRLQITVA